MVFHITVVFGVAYQTFFEFPFKSTVPGPLFWESLTQSGTQSSGVTNKIKSPHIAIDRMKGKIYGSPDKAW